MHTPASLVSVVIPVYNAVSFLERSVGSVLRQQWKDLEIILVENNSTDGSEALATRIAARHPDRVRLAHAERQGASAARNVGWRMAKGNWIQFLDADDTLDPIKLREQMELTATTDARWIIGPYRNLYEDGTTLESIPHRNPWKGLVYRYRIGCTCSNLYHRDALTAVGGWDEELPNGTDPALHLALLKASTPYAFSREVAMTYHHHSGPDRLSTSRPVAGNVQDARLRAAVIEHLRREQPAHWGRGHAFYEGALLQRLRILATHDLAKAAELHAEYFPAGWGGREGVPGDMVSPYIQAMYRWLGFRRTERLRLMGAGVKRSLLG